MTAIPRPCGRRTPNHSRNPFFVHGVYCPPLPLSCPLSKRKHHSKHPFLLFCHGSWHQPSFLRLMEMEKNRSDHKTKRRRRLLGFINPLLALTPAKTDAWGETSEWQQRMHSSPLLSVAVPPASPPCLFLYPSLSFLIFLVASHRSRLLCCNGQDGFTRA